MYFPYYRKISIEDLYSIFTGYECSEDKDVRAHFYNFKRYKWRVIPHSNLLFGKLTFVNFDDLYAFLKFAYIVYPNLYLTLFIKQNEKIFTLSHRTLESH